ncbi:hypothetical protein [Paenibacillus sp. VMFN-D1]|uniref:hypothetical protein n=1 Tax=Paenibacillus sp. VMFN-D1 TaxID=2135608 RepID=UPI000E268322|nr:hypothetical protein [Paenibacillus sp. VMFN-D1]RED36354.1 hypothetical protein C7820_3117 [Paenibacillus sp. VMFN-D1]
MATGYVITREGRVAGVIPKLVEIDGNSMKGERGSIHGINFDVAEILVVDSFLDLKKGDVFPPGYTNVAHKYIKQDPQVQIENNMAALLYENATDKQKIASVEGMLGNLLFDIAIIKGGQ